MIEHNGITSGHHVNWRAAYSYDMKQMQKIVAQWIIHGTLFGFVAGIVAGVFLVLAFI